MDEQNNALKIAVIEEQIASLREQQRGFSGTAQTRFDRIERKLDLLTETINRGRGAYAAWLVVTGIVGGFVLKLAGIVAGFFGR